MGMRFSMLARLIALLCLVYANLIIAALGLNIEAGLSTNSLQTVFSALGFADLYHASYVSKRFRAVADQTIRVSYGILHSAITCLNYTLILYELDTMVQDAKQDKSMD